MKPIDLSNVCEPYYRLAKELSKQVTVKDSGDSVVFLPGCGCDAFCPRGKSFTDNNRTYPGTMPNDNTPFFDYALQAQSEHNELAAVTIPKKDGVPVYDKSFLPCANRKCYIPGHETYCPLLMATYIKYLETYDPKKEKAMRNKYKKSPFLTYTELPPFPFSFTMHELHSFVLSSTALEAGKVLIDMGLCYPSCADGDDVYNIECSFPKYLEKIIYSGRLDPVELKDMIEEYGLDGERAYISMYLPIQPRMTHKYFADTLRNGNVVKPVVYSMMYLVLSYMLLQTGIFPQVMADSLSREIKALSGTDTIFKDNPLLRQENRFYGLLQAEDIDSSENIAMLVADCLRHLHTLVPVIRHMTLSRFAEGLTEGIRDGGFDDIEVTSYKPDKYMVYILDNVDDFLHTYSNLERNNNRSRILRNMTSFFDKLENEYYVLISGTKDELDKLMEIHPSLPLLFGKERMVLKDYTPRQIASRLCKSNEELNDEQTTEWLTEHMDEFPVKNDKLYRYLDNYYKTQGKLPDTVRSEGFKEKLAKMVGMKEVKEQAVRVYNLMKFMKENKTLRLPGVNMHMLFKGNPGTGKTTMARLMADAMYDCGVCKERKLIEVHCPDLVAGYVGQTAIKTRKTIQKAMGGVLFIDEAYALAQSRGDFGREALAVIVKMMEDHKDDLVVIFAGYSDEMEHFLDMNPGLRSRIGYTFDFKDYNKQELLEIFDKKIAECGFTVNDKARRKAGRLLTNGIGEPNFGNGRYVEKIVQETIMEHAQHAENAGMITEKDIPACPRKSQPVKRPIGFAP